MWVQVDSIGKEVGAERQPVRDRDMSTAGVASFREFIGQRGWTILSERDLHYGIQLQVSDGDDKVFVSLYSSGKALIQGKASTLKDEIQAWWDRKVEQEMKQGVVPAQRRGISSPPVPPEGAPAVTSNSPGIVGVIVRGIPRIGLDESGKGDYFGPLVVGAVYVDEGTEIRLADLGVRDSKRLSDSRVATIAGEIRAICPYSLIAIDPKRYNQLYDQFRNLNRLLAWAHACALEELLGKVSCKFAIVDQFGDESFLLEALMERGRSITLEQRPRAEDDVAVAAASILARAEFVERMGQLAARVGKIFPKGASDPAIMALAREIVAERGTDALGEVAKLHFRITEEALSGI